jgi:hypothetical protein
MVSMTRILALASALFLCTAATAQDAYRASVDAWHAERVARLAAEDGWLSLIGRDWLKPGENTLGSAPGATVLLPDWAAPAKAGLLLLEGTAVRFQPLPATACFSTGSRPLRPC